MNVYTAQVLTNMETRNISRYRLIGLACAVLCLGLFLPLTTTTEAVAGSGCPSGHEIHVGTGASEGWPSFGSKAQVWVNNFNTNQFETWRAVAVYQNSNNLVEVGWYTGGGTPDQKAHPYKTRVVDSVPHETNFPNIDIAPRDDFHSFYIQDVNDNNHWNAWMDGSALGTDDFATLTNSASFPVTEAESFCTDDNRLAHFNSLKVIDHVNGSFENYGSLDYFVEVLPWKLCPFQSVVRYDIQQNC